MKTSSPMENNTNPKRSFEESSSSEEDTLATSIKEQAIVQRQSNQIEALIKLSSILPATDPRHAKVVAKLLKLSEVDLEN